jgi:hypothetical protein
VDGEPFRVEPLEPLTDDQGILPPPDPKQFVTYDGARARASPVTRRVLTLRGRRTSWARSRTL